MNQNTSSARGIIDQMVMRSGITKKLAAEILRAIPEVIEEGLKKDGEVRVKGLGTFRLRWTRGKTGRNIKTGERVNIPSHNRVVFLPEHAFKEYINRDNRLLSYKIIPSAEQDHITEDIIPETAPVPDPIIQAVRAEHEPLYHYEPRLQPEAEYIPVAESETEPEIEPSSRKRRIHWIIPVAIGVIIILSGLFYLRNFRTSRQSEVVSQQSSVVSRQSSVVSQQSSVVSRQPEVVSQKEPEPTPNSELRTPNSALSTQNSELKSVPEGTRLFKLARELYGNPYLWVLIYKENQDKIPDPDMVISGLELKIPVLEGKQDRLTRNDSLSVSEGYRLVYEFYLTKDEARAKDFSRAMKRYKPKV